MSITIVHAGDSQGTVVPRKQNNYVLVESRKLLDSNRAHLIRETDSAISTKDRESVFDKACEYLLASFTIKWSENASELEKQIMDRLYRKGHENAAKRLDHLIDVFAEDGDKLIPESVEAFAEFLLENRPQYPGPGIFGDDDGHVGIQWEIPTSKSPDGDQHSNGGILYLEFVSPEHVSYFVDADGISREREVGLNEIMKEIKRFIERLDW